MNAHTFPQFNPRRSRCVQFPFVRSYLRPKGQTERTKGIGISNLMFTERIKENILGVEPDPSNAALLQIESTSVRMQQSVKGQLGIYIHPFSHSISFFFTLDGHILWMRLLFLAKQAIASRLLSHSTKENEGKDVCFASNLSGVQIVHDDWISWQLTVGTMLHIHSFFLGNVISHAGCNWWQPGEGFFIGNWINKCHRRGCCHSVSNGAAEWNREGCA